MQKRAKRFQQVSLAEVRHSAIKTIVERKSLADFGSWQDLHALAQGESDRERLRILVGGLEAALFVRAQQLTDAAGDQEERAAITRACDDLIRIKTEKLGWPQISIAELPD